MPNLSLSHTHTQHKKIKGLYLKYSSFLEFVLFELQNMKCHQQTPQESLPTFLCYKYLHPKIKDIHLNFHTLHSGMSQSSNLCQVVQVPFSKFKYLKYLQSPVFKTPKSYCSFDAKGRCQRCNCFSSVRK